MQPIALIVDRDADTRRMYAEYLKFASWRSEQAADGRDAFIKALTRHHDVIVTGTRLQFISGYALCQLLKRHRTTAAIPIVAVTGDAFKVDVDRAYQAGADVVLIKPCLPDRLVLELNRQLAQETTRPAPGDAAGGRCCAKVKPVPCPSCKRTLIYLEPVGAPDDFDYYICRRGCGTFMYRRLAPRQRKHS